MSTLRCFENLQLDRETNAFLHAKEVACERHMVVKLYSIFIF